VAAVLQGKEFVSASVSIQLDRFPGTKVAKLPLHNTEIVGHHEVVFYSEEGQLLDRLSQFIADALNEGNAAIVIATESHRHNLVRRLQACGLDIDAAVAQGRYIALDAADTILPFVVNGSIDPGRMLESFGDLIRKTANAAKSEHPRVALFGEGADLLGKRGAVEAMIQDEELCNQLTGRHDLSILCGYSLGNIEGGMDGEVFQRICSKHSTVYCP
jgi:hypothetical protein